MGDRYRELMVPLIPINYEGDRVLYQGISMDRKITVEFIRQDGETYLLYERYKLKKVGKL
jgi:hypothetical protein